MSNRRESAAEGASALMEVREVTRTFGARKALDSVDLTMTAGEIVALVGPNGSGKTTLLRLLAGLDRPTSGQLRVFGLEPFRDRPTLMRRLSVAFAPPPLYEPLTAMEHLRGLTALRSRGDPKPTRTDCERVLDRVGLLHRANDRVQTYSFGMRQRLGLALALLPPPDLLVLDEPTDGLDPLAVLELRAILQTLRAEDGLTILLSSHLLFEVDQLVDRMLVLREGVALFCGKPDELRGDAGFLRLDVDDVDTAMATLKARGHQPWVVGDGAVGLAEGTLDLGQASASLGASLTGFSRQRPTLEEALLRRLGREERRG